MTSSTHFIPPDLGLVGSVLAVIVLVLAYLIAGAIGLFYGRAFEFAARGAWIAAAIIIAAVILKILGVA